MVKVVALIRRREDLSREEFLRRWQSEHPEFVRALGGVLRYVQNPAIAHRRDWPYDGLAELWFGSVEAVRAAFEGPAADALREHEESFIGRLDWFLAEETAVPLETGVEK
ncbi:EthD family reductase [Saccharopolyspora erythraea]|uniref:EthD family reductase n=1 Tax=Saccharopolyspora erythraea TaxID=1836 RepID=UPI001BA69F0E|nr:EthD family reductase [Saccharopolyspora erythraea]QUH01812.1 EthD family reductase [Saccharopolyspora erythraea]